MIGVGGVVVVVVRDALAGLVLPADAELVAEAIVARGVGGGFGCGGVGASLGIGSGGVCGVGVIGCGRRALVGGIRGLDSPLVLIA